MAPAKVNPAATPSRPVPTLKKQASSSGSGKNQQSILGFFSKGPVKTTPKPNGTVATTPINGTPTSTTVPSKPAFKNTTAKQLTPVPSSDAAGPSSSDDEMEDASNEVQNCLPSPLTPAETNVVQADRGLAAIEQSSPTRRVSELSTLKEQYADCWTLDEETAQLC